jgi:hypothetical protein
MIRYLSTSWPFDLPPGPEFLWLWIPLAGTLVGLSVIAAIVAGNWLDGPVLRASSLSTSTATPSRSSIFIVGRMPLPQDLLLLAWLRGGTIAVGETLFARAMIAGTLKAEGTRFSILPDVTPKHPGDALFARMLGSLGPVTLQTVRQAMRAAAWHLEPELRQRASEAGLVRPLERKALLAAIGIGGAAVAVVVAVVRIVIRQQLAPQAVFPANLVIAMGFTVLIALLLTAFFTRLHSQVRAYLRWLDDVTTSMKADVTRGSDHDDVNLQLITAMVGLRGLGTAGTALAVYALYPAPTASSAGYDYSSSSSSCGGGGSSCGGGGGSCGGGGGCS